MCVDFLLGCSAYHRETVNSEALQNCFVCLHFNCAICCISTRLLPSSAPLFHFSEVFVCLFAFIWSYLIRLCSLSVCSLDAFRNREIEFDSFLRHIQYIYLWSILHTVVMSEMVAFVVFARLIDIDI